MSGAASIAGASAGLGWGDAWQIARRDLNARFKGLRLLLICIFLGTAALAAIGTLTASIERELQSSGQELLGGDLEVEVWQRDLTEDEKLALSEYGEVSGGYRMQAMANTDEAAAPVELKAVEANWPLYGSFTLADGREPGAPGATDAYLAQGALDRLDIQVGDTFRIGTLTLRAAGVIENEPDRLSEGFQLGPTVLVARDIPVNAGLLQPGSLYQSKYRVAFADSSGSGRPAVAGELPSIEPRAPSALERDGRSSPPSSPNSRARRSARIRPAPTTCGAGPSCSGSSGDSLGGSSRASLGSSPNIRARRAARSRSAPTTCGAGPSCDDPSSPSTAARPAPGGMGWVGGASPGSRGSAMTRRHDAAPPPGCKSTQCAIGRRAPEMRPAIGHRAQPQ